MGRKYSDEFPTRCKNATTGSRNRARNNSIDKNSFNNTQT
jgi:hypothetical protein